MTDDLMSIRPGRIHGAIEVLTQAAAALDAAQSRERAKNKSALYRLHARECRDEIWRLERAIKGELT
jgi:hypothetical protein